MTYSNLEHLKLLSKDMSRVDVYVYDYGHIVSVHVMLDMTEMYGFHIFVRRGLLQLARSDNRGKF